MWGLARRLAFNCRHLNDTMELKNMRRLIHDVRSVQFTWIVIREQFITDPGRCRFWGDSTPCKLCSLVRRLNA